MKRKMDWRGKGVKNVYEKGDGGRRVVVVVVVVVEEEESDCWELYLAYCRILGIGRYVGDPMMPDSRLDPTSAVLVSDHIQSGSILL